MRLNAKQIAACTGGTYVVEPVDSRVIATDLTWDSREVKPGDVYVALEGQHVNGHDFVAAALRSGAVVALVTQPIDEATLLLARELGAAILEVSDAAHAIVDIAREWRTHLKGRVIGLTGSNGKTTTKNLIRDVLAESHTVVATAGNQNNELGVPKTLLTANPETEAIVVEMGMRGTGQIDELCEFVRPDWGVITNVGESHIELLGSCENIARAKAELLCNLPAATGVAFMNADDELAEFMVDDSNLRATGNEIVYFDGSQQACTRASQRAQDAASCRPKTPVVWAEDITLDDQGRPNFTLCACGFDDASLNEDECVPIERQACALALRGMHNVSNACAAAAVGRRFGMDLATIVQGLAGALPEAGRQEILKARGGFTVVNDAYNANPDSMRASLKTFCALEVPGRHIAVLGDMAELGEVAVACHEGIGEMIATLSLDRLVCIGDLAQHIAEAAERDGFDSTRIVRATTLAQALGDLDAYVEPGDAVLVKASHSAGLERVVEGLVN